MKTLLGNNEVSKTLFMYNICSKIDIIVFNPLSLPAAKIKIGNFGEISLQKHIWGKNWRNLSLPITKNFLSNVLKSLTYLFLGYCQKVSMI